MRLRKILLSVFTSVSLLAMIIIAVLAVVTIQKQINAKIESQMSNETNQLAGTIESWISGKAQTVEAMAALMGGKDKLGDYITEDYLNQVMVTTSNQGNVSDLYLGTAEGVMIDGSKATFDSTYDPRQRPWYQAAEKADGVVVTEPYVDMTTNKLAVSIGDKVLSSSGQVQGVIAMDILLDTLTSTIADKKMGETGSAFMIDSKGNFLAHKDSSLLNQKIQDQDGMADAAKVMLAKDSGMVSYKYKNVDKLLVFKNIPSTSWKVGFSIQKSEAYKELRSEQILLATVIVVMAVLVFIICFIAAEIIAKPIRSLTHDAEIASSGDLGVQIIPSGALEVRQLGEAFQLMLRNIGKLVEDINRASGNVMNSSSQIGEMSELTSQVSEEISKTTNELAQGAQRQAESSTESADRVAQMSEAISRITDYSSHSNEVIVEVQQAVQSGIHALEKQTQLMERNSVSTAKVGKVIGSLEDKSKEIEAIVAMIVSIADETNLLALNASIEAARAGEHGRGFAVVASEVGKLAVQSASSSGSIETLLQDIREKTIQTVEEVKLVQSVVEEQKHSLNETQSIYETIADSVAKIVDRIVHISEETKLLQRQSEMMSDAIEEIASVTEESAAATEEVASSTVEQSSSVEKIKAETDRLVVEAKALIKAVQSFKV